MGSQRAAVAATAATLVLWAAAFVAIRAAVRDFSPMGLVLARLLVASLVLGLAAPMLRLGRPARADVPRLAACGLTGMAGYQLLLNAGEHTVEAGTAALLVNTAPICAALLAWALLGARPAGTIWAGIGLGFTGATIIAFTHSGRPELTAGALLVLGAAVLQAAFFVLQKPLLDRYTGFQATCYATWVGTACAMPAAGLLASDLSDARPSALGSVVFLGVGPSAVGFATWAYALARLPVAVAANTLYLVPPIAIAIGWILLGEAPRSITVLGGVVAMAGVVISRRPALSTRRHAKPHSSA